MHILLLALLVNAGLVALTLSVLFAAVVVRTLKGERWEVPLRWSPELEGILPALSERPEAVLAPAYAVTRAASPTPRTTAAAL